MKLHPLSPNHALRFLVFLFAAITPLIAGNSTYNSTVAADSPIAFWSFDETSGTTAADSAGTPQNGVYENCVLGQASAYPNLGTSAQFNGTNARVRMPFDASFNLGAGDFSVELWYRTTVSARGDMFNFKNSIDFGIFANDAASGSLRGYHNGFLPGPITAGAVPINVWHHVVYVRQANVISLYIDGAFNSSQADSVSMSANTDIVVGANINQIWFTGFIDEVAYYGTALSASRVGAHYAAAQATNPNAPLVQTAAATNITSSGGTIGGSFLQVGSPDPTVTMYYGPTNGGTVPANWANNVGLGTRNSAFSTPISGLQPATQYFFIARAQNASGDSFGSPALTFTTANGAPVVANIAATNIFASSATIGGQIVATGGLTPTLTLYYGTTDGGTTAGAWANSVNLGPQTASATTSITGLSANTQYFFRAFATQAAGNSWAPASATFTTPGATPPTVQTDAATDITGYAATMRGTVTSTGDDPPAVRFYYGTTDGGANAAAWTANTTVTGAQSGAFAKSVAGLAGGTTYYYRAFAQNAAGTAWASTSQSFTTGAAVAPTVVISEIHYHPVEIPAFDVNGNPVYQGTATPADFTDNVHEFIEIRNASATPVDISGWKISGGVQFVFPGGTSMGPGEYKVIARNPARINAVYATSGVLGPWTGTLKNGGETVRLENAAGSTVESVNYDREFPWPGSADALGAGDDFTLLNSATYQYKGRSLQRVSEFASSNDASNWLASPLSPGPTPGAANAITQPVPKPVVLAANVTQLSDDSATIRAAQQVRVGITMSTTAALTNPQIEYFLDVVDGANCYTEPRLTVAMTALGNNQFTATLPGQVDRSIVRWRMKANRGDGIEQVYPRTDDAAIVPVGVTTREAWAAYFVQPVRTTTKTAIYDVFVSNSDQTSASFNGFNGLATMNYNIIGNPKRVTNAAATGLPRDIPYVPATAQLWNGSVPCVFVVNGVVRDAHLRYHGSRYNRNAGRNSFKLRFSDTQMINGADSFFVTDKSDYFSVCQGLYINANLPMSEINWVDWYLNNNAVLTRLQQGEYNGDLLDKYHARMATLNPAVPKEENGEFYKDVGTIDATGEGPYEHGSGRRLLAGGPWTSVQRYEWTFTLQNNGWKGAKPIKDFFDGLWNARGDTHTAPNPNIPNLRAYLDAQLDLPSILDSLALANWMCPWDDTTQNHFLWRRTNGKWNHVLWDFDGMFGNGDTTSSNSWIYLGENGTPSPASNALGAVLGNNFRGSNWVKDSIFRAYRTEYNNRLWVLNNTYLHPDNLKTLFFRTQGGGQQSYYAFINGVKASFCEQRFQSVNIQTGHTQDGSDFLRPVKPVATSPVGAVTTLPPASLVASAYAHTSGNVNGQNAHTKSKWEIRRSTGDYFAPVVAVTSATSLTSFSIPFEQLTFGEQYFWRVTYFDGADHPSLTSDEASFSFGPPPSTATLIPFDGSWKYSFAIQPTDASWAAAAFDDSSWSPGAGTLAFEVQAQIPETIRTTLPDPRTLSPVCRAYYFRKHFNCPVNPAQLSNLRIRHVIDDGAVIYINGQLVHRYFMNAAATYPYSVFSNGGPGDGQYQFADAPTLPPAAAWTWVDPRPYMVQGDNVIAVAVYQTNNTSSDITMGLEMTATVPATGGEVVINEVCANPGGNELDFIELKNVTASAVDISGWSFTDDILNPARYTFPAGTQIAAGGYRRMYCSSAIPVSDLNTGFGLDSGGQRLVLTNGNAIKDFVAFGPQARGYSIGRIADGAGAFTLCAPTPEATNAAVATLGNTTALRFNEWMAAPAHGEDWFEIYNSSALPVALGGLWLSDAPGDPQVTQIPPLSYIAPSGHADFIADGTNAGTNHVNFKLSAGGDFLVLSSGYAPLDSLSIASGGANISRGRFPDGAASFANFPLTESRGASNWLESTVVINELHVHSVDSRDAAELLNTSASPVDIGGWWLSDDRDNRHKFQIPAPSVIPSGGLFVLAQQGFGGQLPFGFNSGGETIYLTQNDGLGGETGFRSQVSYGVGLGNATSFGRVLTGAPPGSWKPEFWAMDYSIGLPNTAPIVTPVIINEINYHPPDLAGADNTRDEFIELHNPTTTPVNLSGWRLKGGSDFTFPAGTVLRPGDYILVVGFNPADTATLNAFRIVMGVAMETQVFGPFSPKLTNDEADVEIAYPVAPAGTFVNADKVRYADFAPWPTGPDGTGPSLQRISRVIIGNDPANWASILPTPGRVNTGQSVITDNDGDGIPNAYEDANGLDKFTSDTTIDSDGDGQSNAAEYTSGHSLNDPNSRFTAEALSAAGGAKVRFTAKVGKTYTIQFRNSLTSGTWQKLTDIAAPGADTVIEHIDTSGQPARFYRVATPAQP